MDVNAQMSVQCLPPRTPADILPASVSKPFLCPNGGCSSPTLLTWYLTASPWRVTGTGTPRGRSGRSARWPRCCRTTARGSSCTWATLASGRGPADGTTCPRSTPRWRQPAPSCGSWTVITRTLPSSPGCRPGPDGREQVTGRIWHLPRGHRWRWHGRDWLALGGAVSLDRGRADRRGRLVARGGDHPAAGRVGHRRRACRRDGHARVPGRRLARVPAPAAVVVGGRSAAQRRAPRPCSARSCWRSGRAG